MTFFSDGYPSAEALADAVSPRYQLAQDPLLTARHQWFDTFDWRLHRVGLSLELSVPEGRQQTQFLLRDLNGRVLQATPGGPRGSRRHGMAFELGELIADGPLKVRLAPLVEVRVLLQKASLSLGSRQYRVLDRRGKTIARLVIESPTDRVRNPGLPGSLTRLVPVRGYAGRAAELVPAITIQVGNAAPPGGWLHFALAASSLTQGDYSGQPKWQLTPEMPAPEAIQKVLSDLLECAVRNRPGVVADTDTEFLHDLRVAVRRARTALKLLSAGLAPDLVAQLQAELRWLSDQTAATRDLDCHLLALTPSPAPAADDDGTGHLRAFLRLRRNLAQKQLVRELQSDRWSNACNLWRAVVSAEGRVPRSGVDSPESLPTIAEVAPVHVRRAFRRARRLGRSVTPPSPAAELHALRRRCKELRYLLEFFASLAEPRPLRLVLNQLKALQDTLGAIQDTDVQIMALQAFAKEMEDAGGIPFSTFMTMGAAVTLLEVRQNEARAQFVGRFVAFSDRSTRDQMASLFETSPPHRLGLL